MKIKSLGKALSFRGNFLALVLIAFSFSASAQVYQTDAAYGRQIKRYMVDTTLIIPTVCGVPTLRSVVTKKAAIAFDSCNHKLYFYDPKTLAWDIVAGGVGPGSTDTTYIVAGYGVKIDSLLREYTISADSLIIANKTYVDNKDALNVKYADTALMVKNYKDSIIAHNTRIITNTYNNTLKQNLVTLTTTGSTGAATFNQGTGALNIPSYAGGGSSGDTLFRTLRDVNITAVADYDVARYNTATLKWVNTPSLKFSISGLANDDLLQYVSATGLWENKAPATLATAWKINGNAVASTFIGGTTTDQNVMLIRNNKISGLLDSALKKTYWGVGAGNGTISSGTDNTVGGYNSLKLLTTGNYNTSQGSISLQNQTIGDYQTAIGYKALGSYTTGLGYNTAVGAEALSANGAGTWNTAVGLNSLFTNTGSGNTAMGHIALNTSVAVSNMVGIGYGVKGTGGNSVAVGYEAETGSGIENTAIGFRAKSGSSGSYNVGVGSQSLTSNGAGLGNIGIGLAALYYNVNGNRNVAIGLQVGQFKGYNTGLLTKIDRSVLIGEKARTGPDSLENVVVIAGDSGIAMNSNSTVFGNSVTTKAVINGALSTSTNDYIGLSNPAAATTAQLNVKSISKVFLPSRMTQTQRDAITFSSEVESINLTPGSGYTQGTYPITFSGGGGSGAAGTINVSAALTYTSYIITNWGSGYTSVPTATISAGAGTGGVITVVLANYEGATIFCTTCTATDASTGVLQTRSSGSWRNHY